MIIFTDFKTKCSNYCLLAINQYHKIHLYPKLIYFIDTNVLELKANVEYSKIELLHKIASEKNLVNNQYISIDYPPDMNLQYSDIFIKKSIINNLKYKNNSHYICTIQYNFMDIQDFEYQFNYLKDKINFNNKIIGFGNLCRILRIKGKTHIQELEYIQNIALFLSKAIKKLHWIHLYGLSFQVSEYLIPILMKANNKCIISIDSTKWTKAIDSYLKWKYGFQCNSTNRNLYFLYYIHKLMEKAKIPIFY